MKLKIYDQKLIQKSCRKIISFSNFCIFIQRGDVESTGI